MEKRIVDETSSIVVIVKGGMVQDVCNIPKGVKVEVWDYDTDGVKTNEMSFNDDEEPFVCSTYY